MLKTKPGLRPTIYIDNSVKKENNIPIQSEFSNLRPDIWFIKNNQYYIIEVTIPYGDFNENEVNSLEIRYTGKVDKYKDLCNDIRNQTNKEVNFYAIVISSLGAWFKKSLEHLETLAGSKSLFKRFAKRITLSTLRESQKLITNDYNKLTQNNRDNNANENNDIQEVVRVPDNNTTHSDEETDSSVLSDHVETGSNDPIFSVPSSDVEHMSSEESNDSSQGTL
ncbi:Retrovirus-related Pol polyprotein from type-1 retrotransposable element R2 [Histomonas meleagridis]|nr:Retrovirus-related Pol polyprotein from type-1 retrotransposable element R2 [Histomonas meleagridis]